MPMRLYDINTAFRDAYPDYQPAESAVHPWARSYPGLQKGMPRYDVLNMPPWSLFFADDITFGHKVRGARPRMLFAYDVVTGGMRRRYFRQLGVVYGSASAAKRWENTLHPWLEKVGFKQGDNDKCVFYHAERKCIVITYVDDLLVRAERADVEWFMAELAGRFDCKNPQYLDVGKPLDHLGMTVFRDDKGVYVTMEGWWRFTQPAWRFRK